MCPWQVPYGRICDLHWLHTAPGGSTRRRHAVGWECHAPGCVQEAMRTAEKLSTDDIEVKMKLVAPPLYVLTTQTLEKARGLELLRDACDRCREVMEERRGKIVVKSEARVVSAQEDKLLDDQLQQLAASNAEVDGDADSEEAEEGMGEVDLSGPGMST